MQSKFIVLSTLLVMLLTVVASPALAAKTDNKEYIKDYITPESYLENMSYKLVRGVTNIVTSPAELPKQIIITTESRGALGALLGLFKGVGMTAMRAGTGVLETVTFFVPNSTGGDFKPILKPEYVWDPSEPTSL